MTLESVLRMSLACCVVQLGCGGEATPGGSTTGGPASSSASSAASSAAGTGGAGEGGSTSAGAGGGGGSSGTGGAPAVAPCVSANLESYLGTSCSQGNTVYHWSGY